jgi:hypothetical protein
MKATLGFGSLTKLEDGLKLMYEDMISEKETV